MYAEEQSGRATLYKDKTRKLEASNPPVCLNHKSEKGCVHGVKCHFRHVEAEEKPSKKSKKSGVKGSVATMKESLQFGCVSQDCYSEKIYSTSTWKIGIKSRCQFLQGHLAPNRKIGIEKGTECAPSPCLWKTQREDGER